MPYCNAILWIYHIIIISIALAQSFQNRIQCIFVYPMSSNGINSQSQLPRVILYTYSWYCNCWEFTNVTYFGKTHITVIALMSKMKNTTVRKCLDCLSEEVMMKSVHKYKKLTKQIFTCNCNAVKCLLHKKLFVSQQKIKNKNINEVKQIYL